MEIHKRSEVGYFISKPSAKMQENASEYTIHTFGYYSFMKYFCL